jgi:hypothetical protein
MLTLSALSAYSWSSTPGFEPSSISASSCFLCKLNLPALLDRILLLLS